MNLVLAVVYLSYEEEMQSAELEVSNLDGRGSLIYDHFDSAPLQDHRLFLILKKLSQY